MAATPIDGKVEAARLRAEFKGRAAALAARGRRPGLAVVLVGEDPASRVYVGNKEKACAEVGLHSEVHRLPATASQSAVEALIDRLNADPAIHGIIVQQPLPKHLEIERLIERIDVDKDVDGFHPGNLGRLVRGEARYVPCTPAGIMVLLERAGIELSGRHAVVVGRSEIVGKPMALLLIRANATVTVCNSRTRDLSAHTRAADVLVVATGKPGLVTGDMIRPGAAVIDVGINRLPDGRLVGDVDFPSAAKVAGWLTPVPGGVGPMTVALLIGNTLAGAERRG